MKGWWMKMNYKKETLNGFLVDTKNQIAVFDQKAGIMLTTIGIMFALITYFCDIFDSDAFIKGKDISRCFYSGFFLLFCLSAIFSLACFTMVIIPRRKPRKTLRNNSNEKHINYYMDGATLEKEEFKKMLSTYVKDDDVLIQQVINNDMICVKKHKFITAGIIGLVPFILLTFIMIIFIIFIF